MEDKWRIKVLVCIINTIFIDPKSFSIIPGRASEMTRYKFLYLQFLNISVILGRIFLVYQGHGKSFLCNL